VPEPSAPDASGSDEEGPDNDHTIIDAHALRLPGREALEAPAAPPPDEEPFEEKTAIAIAPHVLARQRERAKSTTKVPVIEPASTVPSGQPPPLGVSVSVSPATADKPDKPAPRGPTAIPRGPSVVGRAPAIERDRTRAPSKVGPPPRAGSITLSGGHAPAPAGPPADLWQGEERTPVKGPLDPAEFERAGEAAVEPASEEPGHLPADEELVGPRFGPYEILRVIARGHRGTVYLALHHKSTEPVALKVLRRKLGESKEHLERFRREAKAALAIESKHVVKVLDVGTIGDRHYLAMRYVDGWTLRERLDSGDTPGVSESLRITREVAHAIAAAGERDIVHRDIKPDTILIARDGGVLLMDFGLATLIDRSEGKDHPRPRRVVGTAHYIAPEQATGSPVDSRSDFYALGATLFQLLTGRTLYSGRSSEEIATKHVREPPPDIEAVRPGLPPPVVEIARRLIQKRPEDRHHS
jgi:predicted Ser/Thr protein kinase